MNQDTTTAPPQQNNSRRRGRRRRGRRRDGPPRQETPLDNIDFKVDEDTTVIVGITGEAGAGKSALAQQFAALGATILDVDAIGHEVIEGPATKKKIVDTFGEDILDDDGRIDRPRLAEKAFVDAASIAALNKMVDPRLTTRVKTMLKKAGNFVVIDAARLTELGLDQICTQTVYVQAPEALRVARVSSRGWDAEELARRQERLGDPEQRRKACQLTVDNSGDQNLLGTYAKTILARQLGIDLASLRPEAPKEDEGEADGVTEDGTVTVPAAAKPPPAPEPMRIDLDDYLRRGIPNLQEEGEKLDIRDVRSLNKHDLISQIIRRVAGNRNDEIMVQGFLEKHKDQHAYLRSPLSHYLPNNTDTFISGQHMRRAGLRAGMHITGIARAPRGNERCPQLLSVTTAMGHPIDQRPRIERFENLTPLHAEDRLFMERQDKPTDLSLRIIDLIAPIGKGQRGLIVSQPKCGKTVYLQKIANAITANNPDVTLMVLLVDERPEEVTDMERNVEGEVIASTFDQKAQRHVQCAEIAITKAKRLVEQGKDVVILLDSITRLARAYNTEAPSSGRIMSGGIESGALIRPKQFFGAARNIEHGGSLTILATALVDTGSVMDTVIFEEFKGTGNMELVLDRRLANRRVFPAIDVAASGTRKDDLLIKDPEEMRRLWALRKFLAERSSQDAIEFLKSKIARYNSNVEFLMNIDPDRVNQW